MFSKKLSQEGNIVIATKRHAIIKDDGLISAYISRKHLHFFFVSAQKT